jgi:hypothetical protein
MDTGTIMAGVAWLGATSVSSETGVGALLAVQALRKNTDRDRIRIKSSFLMGFPSNNFL